MNKLNNQKRILGVILLLVVGGMAMFSPWRIWYKNFKKVAKSYYYYQAASGQLPEVQFQKIALGAEAEGYFSSLTFGPDGKLYAACLNGQIKRFKIEENGFVKLEHTFQPFGTQAKLMIGLHFDPHAHSDSLVAWITYSNHPELHDAPEWDGRLAFLQLATHSDSVLQHQVVIKHLPRSAHDHLTNSLDFGPDGNLYIAQGSNTSMGYADNDLIGKKRQESLLSGAILRLHLDRLPQQLPIDAKTHEGGGNYNPFAKNAPLTIYATGMRNAYDLVWHSNGQLYVSVNGSKSKEHTPTSNPKSPRFVPLHPLVKYNGPTNIPEVAEVAAAQDDYLARAEEGGFYGHPNPRRGEYILNHGDRDVPNREYKGLAPDPNFRGFSYNFGKHASANGIIEYQSQVFGGRLAGKLLVARFNNYNDVMALEPGGPHLDIVEAYDGKPLGLAGMNMPLDLVEDTRNGNLYVSEYGGKAGITLFRPIEKPGDRLEITQEEAPTSQKVTLALTKTGKTIFEENCQACHGPQGVGGAGPSLQDNKWRYGSKAEQVKGIILNGSEEGMPAWKQHLSNQEIDELATYVLSLRKTAGLSLRASTQ
ncbi:MAG: hypothetical protein OHK0053_00710 [Microscillaceae bacterium]